VKTDLEIARKLNDEPSENKMSEKMMEDYAGRLEIPKTKGTFSLREDRWDNPMFVIEFNDELPCEEITTSLLEGKKPRAPVSTKPVKWSISSLGTYL
jgi:tRNA uridine 5-carbamoylmethylation protein Kti12